MVGSGLLFPPSNDRGGDSVRVSSDGVGAGLSRGESPLTEPRLLSSSSAARGSSSPRGLASPVPSSSPSTIGGVHAIMAAIDGGPRPRCSPRLLASLGMSSAPRLSPPPSPPSRLASPPIDAMVADNAMVTDNASASEPMDVHSSVGDHAAPHAGLLPLPLPGVDRLPLDPLHEPLSSTASNAHVSSPSSGLLADSSLSLSVSSQDALLWNLQPAAAGYVTSTPPCRPCPAPRQGALELPSPMVCDSLLDSAAPPARPPRSSPPSAEDFCMDDVGDRPSLPCPVPIFSDDAFPPLSAPMAGNSVGRVLAQFLKDHPHPSPPPVHPQRLGVPNLYGHLFFRYPSKILPRMVLQSKLLRLRIRLILLGWRVPLLEKF